MYIYISLSLEVTFLCLFYFFCLFQVYLIQLPFLLFWLLFYFRLQYFVEFPVALFFVLSVPESLLQVCVTVMVSVHVYSIVGGLLLTFSCTEPDVLLVFVSDSLVIDIHMNSHIKFLVLFSQFTLYFLEVGAVAILQIFILHHLVYMYHFMYESTYELFLWMPFMQNEAQLDFVRFTIRFIYFATGLPLISYQIVLPFHFYILT